MINGIAKKYVTYVCNSYNEESLKKIINVVRNFNSRNSRNLKLVVSGLPLMNYLDCGDIINIGFASCDNPYILGSKAMIIDDEKQLKNNMLIEYLHKGIICLVNKKCKDIAKMCENYGVGLIYSDYRELLAMIEYIEKNRKSIEIPKMIYNASGCDESVLIKTESEQIKDRVSERKYKIKSFIEMCDNNVSPEEKVAYITQNVMDDDREVILKCTDRMEFGNKFVEMLMVYKYIKLYINPEVKFYFTSSVNISSAIYRMIKSLIKELAIKDVFFDTVQENENTKVLELKSYYNKNNSAVSIEDNSVEYVAEQIGMLL